MGALNITDDDLTMATPEPPGGEAHGQKEEEFRLLVETVRDYAISMLSPTLP
jgi:hypothetical protein